MVLNIKDIELMLDRATNSELYQLKALIEKEIRLSETAIQEGFEKKR